MGVFNVYCKNFIIIIFIFLLEINRIDQKERLNKGKRSRSLLERRYIVISTRSHNGYIIRTVDTRNFLVFKESDVYVVNCDSTTLTGSNLDCRHLD